MIMSDHILGEGNNTTIHCMNKRMFDLMSALIILCLTYI